jgi:hypothetical protein
VTRPDAIPLLAGASRAVLDPPATEALFGRGYRWRGSERVRLGNGTSVAAAPGDVLRLTLDRIDAAAAAGPLRLVGPRGSIDAPQPRVMRRELVLPAGMRRAWGLEAGQSVCLQAGTVIITGVLVVEGEPAGARLDRADLLAAGLEASGTVALRRDVLPPAGPSPEAEEPARRLITENDVRQARLHGRRIVVRSGQILTPAARTLGRELGVLDWPDA